MRFLPFLLCPALACADAPGITDATFQQIGDTWRVSVTLVHGDTGWDDYADGWRVEAEDGTILGYRALLHPHVNEQPFTRSQSGIALPDGAQRVFIRARDSVGGWADQRVAFELPQGS